MNNAIGISGSPKINRGASNNYLDLLNLDIINSNSLNVDIKRINNYDIIVFSYPLYVDGLPSHFLKFLNDMEKEGINNKKIYAICNMGFHEPIQGKTSLDIIRNFCIRTSNTYMGGLCIGSGPIGFKKYIINIPIKKEIKRLKNKIKKEEYYENNYKTCKIPHFLYRFFANKAFKKEIKNNLIKNKSMI